MFVSLLDEISVKYVGSHLRRDTKGKKTGRDFVRAISDIGGFKLTPGSIDEALKQVVKGRGEIGAQQPR